MRAVSIIILSVLIFSVTLSGCRRNIDEVTDQTHDSVYVKQGNMIVSATFDSLRNSLLRAIGTQGFEGAITYCNVNAFVLTNTYADSVSIERTALRYRNPKNKPDSLEQVILESMTSELKPGAVPGTKIIRDDLNGEIHYFKPIMMQAMCLNCHGKPNDQINEKTSTRIRQLYPRDRAVDFKEGDLRGVWHIIFSPRK
jgi:hypothetical protein